MTRSLTGIAALVIAATAVVGAGLLLGGGGKRTLVRGIADPRWPEATLQDWAGFADHVALVSVAAEQRLETPQTVRDAGTGLVGRMIEVTVGRVLWSRPGVQPLPSSLGLAVDGWWFEDGELVPYAALGFHRPVVGEALMIPVLLTTDLGWTLLDSSMPVRDGIVRADKGQGSPMRELDGLTLDGLASRLRSMRPTAVAEIYAHLDPDVRAQAVRDARVAAPG